MTPRTKCNSLFKIKEINTMPTETLSGYRLSPLQRRLWLAQQEGIDYRAQCGLWLQGQLDAPRFKEALQKMVSRHEILRTSFHRAAGMKVPLQIIRDQVNPEWQVVDWSACGDGGFEERICELLRAEGRRPFDWERGPLVRVCLASLSADKHFFLLTVPTLCGDGETLKNLVKEIRCLYAGDIAGRELEEQPLQYADFSEWHNQLLEAEDEDSQAGKKYWGRLSLASMPPLALPFQKRPQSETGVEPDYPQFTIPLEVMAKIKALAQQHEASTGTVLLAAWHALLGRLTGQSDIVVGNTLDGRKQEELRGAMGLFAPTVPIVAHLDDQSFIDLLDQVRGAVTAAIQWQEYFDIDTVPLPTVHFECTTGLSRQAVDGVVFSEHGLSCHVGSFLLKLSIALQEDSTRATIAYDPERFQREDVQRLAGYLQRLLEGVTLDPRVSVNHLEILDPEESRRLLVSCNQTAAKYPFDRCIHELFEKQAARTSERSALVFEEQLFSYVQLNARANQLAHYLRQQGVGRNVPVGLCMERSAEMLVGLLGILKAGGAYVPLHSELPKARLAYQIAETKSPLVITQESLLPQLPEIEAVVFCLDRDLAKLTSQPLTNPGLINDSNDLAYVIYTSGSTGVPKGVAVRHRNLVNYAHFIRSKLGLDKLENSSGFDFATVSTLSADLGNTCIFPSLISGGCLHVISYETSMDANRFARYVAAHPIDVLKITPSHLSALLAIQPGEAILPRKFLILGGEASSWELIRRVKEAGKCAVVNHYGPTETTVGSLTFTVSESAGSGVDSATVPIGRPIANTEVYILDSRHKPTPFGAPGELCIGGAGLAQGYLNQPQETAKRFVKNPFSNDASARLYKTGDRVRYLPDGNIEFLGRLDQQVKIRGFRVEPAEIEGVLRQHPALQQAVVVAQDNISGDKRLVAYFVPVLGRGAQMDELRSFLLEQLPDYMVPSVYVALESLPLTPNGKVDYRALPDPDQARPQADKTFVAPRNEVEEVLAGIWAEVLKLDQVGIHDNFFELGGHSLLATQVISRIRAAFEVQLPLRSIFEAPTVAGLAKAVAQCHDERTDDAELSRMLAELEGLPEEEVQRLLALEMQQEAG
jgi:amino acid adenylation domain-containing protein